MTASDTPERVAIESELVPLHGQFVLRELPYAVTALEPVIDAETLMIHHDKHHRAYVDGLNHALNGAKDLAAMPLEEVLATPSVAKLAPPIQTALHNMGGGHFNHAHFWRAMSQDGGKISESFAQRLAGSFGTVDRFMEQFEAAGARVFGSGWVWLCRNRKTRDLEIATFANQDTWIGTPRVGLLACDVWEHAYYLKYRNRRADWLHHWWQVVDWQAVEQRWHTVP